MFSIVLLGFLLATFCKNGIFENIGLVLAGLLPIVHPVCPEAWKWKYRDNEKRMQRDSRMGGAIVILLSLITRFGI